MVGELERGSTVPLIAPVVVLIGVVVMGPGRLSAAGVARASARTAADAAALAGAADGRAAAEALARANGAELVGYEGIGLDTRVTVRVGSAEAVGRARRVGGGGGPPSGAPAAGGGAGADGLAPAMRAALARAEQLLGHPVPIVSGYRSPEAQAALWANRATNPYPVAPPGSSMHERGLAVDVPLDVVPRLAAVAGQAGLCHPHPDDPVHFEVCR